MEKKDIAQISYLAYESSQTRLERIIQVQTIALAIIGSVALLLWGSKEKK